MKHILASTKSNHLNVRWFVYSLTLHSLAQVVSLPLLVDDRLVDLPSGEVVVSGKTDVQETLIIPQVQIYLPTII